MEIDSPPPEEGGVSLSPQELIVQSLAINGIPKDVLQDLQSGLVRFVKTNTSLLPGIVSTILPNDSDVAEAPGHPTLRELYRESILWLKWLMFDGDPSTALNNLAQMSVDQGGVCGAVWGKNDLAFRCRTCEHDPTCAICVPCFQNGNHKNHDYSIIYTGGGCCDCGDESAWKRDGFCSKHKGAEKVQPLPDDIGNSVGPVLDALFRCWKEKLSTAEVAVGDDSSVKEYVVESKKVVNELTYVSVELLLDFCKHSESLLSFVSRRMLMTVGLLNLLVRAERILNITVTKKLHELFLKLLGDPTFKLEFAKVFIDYYPSPVAEVLKASNDNVLKKYPLLSMFAVQIFTVPTLTPCLVKECNLLATLLECLGEILLFCSGEDGRFLFNNWVGVFDTCIRVMEDIKFVLSHSVVAKHVTHERLDVVRTWLQILSLAQGMNPQKRETGLHVEEENEHAHLPFIMCNSIAGIHLLLLEGAFSAAGSEVTGLDTDDVFSQRHAKVGKLSEESYACSSAGQSSDNLFEVPPSVSHLISELLNAIDCWLGESSLVASGAIGISPGSVFSSRKSLLKAKKGYCISNSLTNKHIHTTNVKTLGRFQVHHEIGEWPLDAGGSDDHNPSFMETDKPSEDSLKVLSLSDWPDIVYDVSAQEVSVHMPLHGLLALILKEALKKFYGEHAVTEKSAITSLNAVSSNNHVFFEKLLKRCHPLGFSSFMMEHPLQSRVFCSQVRAGMWRKNGDAALVCYEWYRSIRWAHHELEVDLFLLQICGALAPADSFVSRVLERFQLTDYLALGPTRSSEYEPVLVQEFLTLIIQIVKERRFCGLTDSESLQRELVCKLATGDVTRSQLGKSLPKDLSKLDLLQEVLDNIAQYSNPTGMNQGKYSLRLPYWKELDLYHPCWNPKDLQVAEERYSRFCGVSALSAQLPKWTKIYQPLAGIARIATCKTVVHINRAVLYHYVSKNRSEESRAPDGVLITALHLLSLGLDVCFSEKSAGRLSSYDIERIPLLAFADEEVGVDAENHSGKQTLLSLLVSLMSMHRKDNVDNFMEAGSFNLSILVEYLLKKFAELDSKCLTKLQQIAPEVVGYQADETVSRSFTSDTEKRKLKARERQAAILAKMKAEQSKFMATLKSSTECATDDTSSDEEHASEATRDSEEAHTCSLCHDPNSRSPVSFLILLQKSRLVNFLDRGPPTWDQGLRSDEHGSSVARETENSKATSVTGSVENFSTSQFQQLVQGAVNEFACQAHPAEVNAFIDYIKLHFPEVRHFGIPLKSTGKKDKVTYPLESLEQDVFLSVKKEMQSAIQSSYFLRECEELPSQKNAAKSEDLDSLLLGKYVASLTRECKESSQNSSSRVVESVGHIASYDGFGALDCDGIHVSSCGHAVHQGCLDRYLSSLKERYTRRMVFEGGHIVDPDQGEFLCPVCRRLANSALPTAPRDARKLLEQSMDLSPNLGSLAVSGNEISSLQLQCGLQILQAVSSVVARSETLKDIPLQQESTFPNVDSVFQVLSTMFYPGKQDALSRSGRVSPSVLMWDTLKYTLVSTEIAARCGRNSLAARRGLTSLYGEYESSGGFILPLLLRITQSSKTNNLPDVLLRLRSIRIFAASVCFGVSYHQHSEGVLTEEGKILSILKHANPEVTFPDTQFWDQASVPVLTRDPFSTLMWILFCLPHPLLLSQESLLSLIHMFYGVAVAQAIITYCVHAECEINELDFNDCLVSDIAKFARESDIAKRVFVSNFFDPSCQIKDSIESYTLPYLRRCALLCKLLRSCSSSSSSLIVDDVGTSLDISECAEKSDAIGDTNAVDELRHLFKIPKLDAVLKDKLLRLIGKKWFFHISTEYKDQGLPRTLTLTPAVPFKLMHLPVVYQDLVQRYIKPRCPNCKAVQDEPALCLLCGRLCSPAWKPCCRESGCQTHAGSCGAGTGVFLLIRKSTILLQRNARQATWPSPYLDAFGEEDIDMHRGRPLFLNEERYAALTYMLASHGLDRSSKVLRQTTVGTFFLV